MEVIVIKTGKTVKPKAFVGELVEETPEYIKILLTDWQGKKSTKKLSRKNLSIRILG